MAGAAALAYAGGVVIHRAWHSKGNQKAAMLALAVGTTLLGLRIALVCLAVGDVLTARARVEDARIAVKALDDAAQAASRQAGAEEAVRTIAADFKKRAYTSKVVESLMAEPPAAVVAPQAGAGAVAP